MEQYSLGLFGLGLGVFDPPATAPATAPGIALGGGTLGT